MSEFSQFCENALFFARGDCATGSDRSLPGPLCCSLGRLSPPLVSVLSGSFPLLPEFSLACSLLMISAMSSPNRAGLGGMYLRKCSSKWVYSFCQGICLTTYTSERFLPNSARAFLNGVGVRGSRVFPSFRGVLMGPLLLPSSSALSLFWLCASLRGIGVLNRLVSFV